MCSVGVNKISFVNHNCKLSLVTLVLEIRQTTERWFNLPTFMWLLAQECYTVPTAHSSLSFP
jgi:hypothetical protein